MYYVTTKFTRGSKTRVLLTTEKRATARTEAANRSATVRTEDELNKMISDGAIDLTSLPGYVAPEVVRVKTLVDLALEIKAANRKRRTVGKVEKTAKRVITEDAVILEATEFAKVTIAAGLVKVGLVRALAGWESSGEKPVKLQRRDLYAILHGLNVDVADATISTQFQLVRSGGLVAK
jgi:hypothetical protein